MNALSALLALAAGTAGLAFPFVQGPATFPLILVITALCFAASVSHAAVSRGGRSAAGLVLIVTGGSLCIEIAGLRFGLPFGPYVYGDGLGPQVFGVPLLVPLAWTMMAYPAVVIASRITTHRVWGSIAAGCALGAWDLFVDPLMVREGFWRWAAAGPTLAGIPLTNYLGWIGMVALLTIFLWPLLVRRRAVGWRDDRVPVALYAGSGVVLLMKTIVQDMPGAALTGALGMGAVLWLAAINQRRPAEVIGPADHRWARPALATEGQQDVSRAAP
jgi:putative membrane protein